MSGVAITIRVPFEMDLLQSNVGTSTCLHFSLTIWGFFLFHFDCILRRGQCFRWQCCGEQYDRAAVGAAPSHVAEAAVRVGADLQEEYAKCVVVAM